MQGGELFALPGFRDLLDDVSATVSRPVISISTNGTMIDGAWAERIVRTPFRNVTVSIDGGTSETYARMRVGADLHNVLANIGRIRSWKKRLGSEMPFLDSFFVIMRSNFREIPQYLELMRGNEIFEVALQTVQINKQNTVAAREAITDAFEVRELHGLLTDTLARERGNFRNIRLSGLQSLFEAHGLDVSFLEEQASGLYPDSEGLGGNFALCPNPWTTMFISEDGNVFLCFLSEPIGNLYETPLATLWNSPRALAKRSLMIAGRYAEAGCSRLWCSWREGRPAPAPTTTAKQSLLTQLLDVRNGAPRPAVDTEQLPSLAAIRRLLADKERRIAETESLLEPAQIYIDHLETKVAETESLLAPAQLHIDHLEAKAAQAVASFSDVERQFSKFRERSLVRVADKLSRSLVRLRQSIHLM